MAPISQSSPYWTLVQDLAGWTTQLYLSFLRSRLGFREVHLIYFHVLSFWKKTEFVINNDTSQSLHAAGVLQGSWLGLCSFTIDFLLLAYILLHSYADDPQLYCPPRPGLKNVNPPVAQGFQRLRSRNIIMPLFPAKHRSSYTLTPRNVWLLTGFTRRHHTAPVQALLSLAVIKYSNTDQHHVITEMVSVALLEPPLWRQLIVTWYHRHHLFLSSLKHHHHHQVPSQAWHSDLSSPPFDLLILDTPLIKETFPPVIAFGFT